MQLGAVVTVHVIMLLKDLVDKNNNNKILLKFTTIFETQLITKSQC